MEASAPGTQTYRAIIYKAKEDLPAFQTDSFQNDFVQLSFRGHVPGDKLWEGPQISKTGPFDPTWDKTFLDPLVSAPSGSYWAGIITGPSTEIIKYANQIVTDISLFINDDTENDGASAVFGSGTTDTRELSIIVEGR